MSKRGLAWCWICLGLFVCGMFLWFVWGLPNSPNSGKWYVSGLMNGAGMAIYAVGVSMLENAKREKP